MGQFLEEVILELADLVVLHIKVVQAVLLFQGFWQAFQAHFLEDQLLHELQSAQHFQVFGTDGSLTEIQSLQSASKRKIGYFGKFCLREVQLFYLDALIQKLLRDVALKRVVRQMQLDEIFTAFEGFGEGLDLIVVGLDQLKRGDEQSKESVEVYNFVIVDTQVLHFRANYSNVFGELDQLVVVELYLDEIFALYEEVLADVFDLVVAEEGYIKGLWASEGQCLEEVVLQLQISEFGEAGDRLRQILQFILIQLEHLQLSQLSNPLRNLFDTISSQCEMIQPLQLLDLLRHFPQLILSQIDILQFEHLGHRCRQFLQAQLIQLQLGQIAQLGDILRYLIDLIVPYIQGLQLKQPKQASRQFFDQIVPDVQLLQIYEFCQHVDILDPISTEDQLIQILEALTDELNITDIIIRQFQKFDLLSIGAIRIQDLLQCLVIDFLTYQRYKLFLFFVDALDQLRKHEVVLGLDPRNVHDFGALVDRQLEDYEVILEGLYFFFGVQFGDEVDVFWSLSVVQPSLALYVQFHKFLHAQVFGLDGETDTVHRYLVIVLQSFAIFLNIQIIEQFLYEGFVAFLVDPTLAAERIIRAFLTSLMGPDIVGMGVGLMASAADKGLIVPLHVMSLFCAAVIKREQAYLLLFAVCHLLVDLTTTVQAPPYAAELTDRTEDRPLDLIDEVIVLIGALDEIRVIGVDCQLRLADEHILVSDIHQDIIRTFLQTIFDPDDFEDLRTLLGNIRKMFEQLQDFFLL